MYNEIQGAELGLHIHSGSDQNYIGNVVRGGIQIGGEAPGTPKTSLENLAAAIATLENESDRQRLVLELKHLIEGDPKDRVAAYKNFIGAAANHVTILAPFLPFLSSLLR